MAQRLPLLPMYLLYSEYLCARIAATRYNVVTLDLSQFRVINVAATIYHIVCPKNIYTT